MKPLTVFAVGLAAASALACAGEDRPAEAAIVGIWQRRSDDGLWAVREFAARDQWEIEFDNRNWLYAPGESPMLYSEARYFVEGDILRVSTLLETRDRIVDVSDTKLVLGSVYDDSELEYEKVDALP